MVEARRAGTIRVVNRSMISGVFVLLIFLPWVGAQSVIGEECEPTILFDSTSVPGGAIFRFDQNTGQAVHISGSADSPASKPHLSPDGQSIAFVRFLPNISAFPEIWLMDASGRNYRTLTPGMSADQPSWSPDGNRITFTSTRDGNREVYVMDADGSGLQRLTDHEAVDDYPVWSPDGEHIAFGSLRNGEFDLFVMRSDGTELRQLTSHPAGDFRPAWSPDGEWIAFSSTRGDPTFDLTYKWDIYVIRPDGSDVRRITSHELLALRPSWSPSGDEIVYQAGGAAEDGSDWEIYTVAIDGGIPVRLTDNSVSDSHPDWNTYRFDCR